MTMTTTLATIRRLPSVRLYTTSTTNGRSTLTAAFSTRVMTCHDDNSRTHIENNHYHNHPLSYETLSHQQSPPVNPQGPSPNRRQRPIYVAATKQHVGKTSVSLSLMSGLRKRFDNVGFIKPVGQQFIKYSQNNTTIPVDKDAYVMGEHFSIPLDYRDMSPLIISRGYTKDYLDGRINHYQQLTKIQKAFQRISSQSDVVLCEGTGHVAVGSVIELNNAMVARMIQADMVLVANGENAIDDLELNRVLCDYHGVNIAGVIINKVIPEKLAATKAYFEKILMDMWGIKLLGCIPDKPLLGCPSLADLEVLYGARLVSGERWRMRAYNIKNTDLITTSLSRFCDYSRTLPNRTLYFCHSSRHDIIEGFLAAAHQRKRRSNNDDDGNFEAAMVLCDREMRHPLSPEILKKMNDLDIPVLVVPFTTQKAMRLVNNYTPKSNVGNKDRVSSVIDQYERHINFDLLLGDNESDVVDEQQQSSLLSA